MNGSFSDPEMGHYPPPTQGGSMVPSLSRNQPVGLGFPCRAERYRLGISSLFVLGLLAFDIFTALQLTLIPGTFGNAQSTAARIRQGIIPGVQLVVIPSSVPNGQGAT